MLTPRGVELRYADRLWSDEPELDEVCAEAASVHIEDLGQAVFVNVGDVRMTFYVDWLPRSLWWEEVVDAWYSRTWPHFCHIVLRVDEVDP